jgi:hypothetical protein
MAGLAPEVGEKVFRGLPGQLQIDSIGTQLDLIIPADLPGGADVDLSKELLILPRLEDALPRQLRQVHGAFRAVRENTTLIRKFGNALTEIGFTIFGPSPSTRIIVSNKRGKLPAPWRIDISTLFTFFT